MIKCEVVKSSAGGKEFYYCRVHKKEAKIPSSCLEIETEVATTVKWPDTLDGFKFLIAALCECQYPLVGRPHAEWCSKSLSKRVDNGEKTYD